MCALVLQPDQAGLHIFRSRHASRLRRTFSSSALLLCTCGRKKKKDTDLWESSPGSALPDGSQESFIQPREG